MHISENQKSKYLHILERMKLKCSNSYTQKEFADIFEISRSTFNKFWNAKIIDMNMLISFGNFIDVDVFFFIEENQK